MVGYMATIGSRKTRLKPRALSLLRGQMKLLRTSIWGADWYKGEVWVTHRITSEDTAQITVIIQRTFSSLDCKSSIHF